MHLDMPQQVCVMITDHLSFAYFSFSIVVWPAIWRLKVRQRMPDKKIPSIYVNVLRELLKGYLTAGTVDYFFNDFLTSKRR